MGKYDKLCLEVLTDEWQNTNQVVKRLNDRHNKWASWHLVHRALTKLHRDGKIECASDGKFSLWRLRQG